MKPKPLAKQIQEILRRDPNVSVYQRAKEIQAKNGGNLKVIHGRLLRYAFLPLSITNLESDLEALGYWLEIRPINETEYPPS